MWIWGLDWNSSVEFGEKKYNTISFALIAEELMAP
jgi:hypothetical protein